MKQENNVRPEDENKHVENSLQSKLSEQMMGVFELVVSDRSNHFSKHPNQIPDLKSVPAIIKSYSVTNAAISGGASLVPGPWGMIAVIPEIAAVIRNQLAMIYDIGMANGKSNVLTKELLAGVLLTALGSSAGSLLIMQGSKVFVKRVSLRAFQRIIVMLAGKITQQALKSAISKWLPVVGAAAMAAWSNYLTRQVGKKADEIFQKEIIISSEIVDEVSLETEHPSLPGLTVERVSIQPIIPDKPKVQTLINLIKVDGMIKAEERDYINTIISNAELTASEKTELLQSIDASARSNVDYSVFASSPEDAIGLLVDMITLAKRDGTFHVTEKIFVKKVGKLLGFSDSDIDELMESDGNPG